MTEAVQLLLLCPHCGPIAACSIMHNVSFYAATPRLTSSHAWQVVFWDMRNAVLEDLYRHSVANARMHPVIEGLDGWLGQLCSAAVPDLHPLLARALLLAAVNALLRVLLHGGPFR